MNASDLEMKKRGLGRRGRGLGRGRGESFFIGNQGGYSNDMENRPRIGIVGYIWTEG